MGHPDYYKKFGFKNMSGLVLEGVPQEVFFALSFDGRIPQGTSLSTKDSKRIASQSVQATLDSVPDLHVIFKIDIDYRYI